MINPHDVAMLGAQVGSLRRKLDNPEIDTATAIRLSALLWSYQTELKEKRKQLDKALS